MKNKPPFVMKIETEMESFRYRTWATKEPETIAWLDSLYPDSVLYDVGANIGIYSLYFASQCRDGRVYAFEPMQANFVSLVQNVMMNGFNITPLPWAIGSFDGYAHLETPEMEAGKSGAQIRDWPVAGLSTLCRTIDTLREYEAGYPLYVKIDIDGQELEVVRGMTKTLPHIKSCLIEVSKRSKGPIMDIMTAAGFKTDNRFNTMTPHSRERRAAEGIDAENIVFTR